MPQPVGIRWDGKPHMDVPLYNLSPAIAVMLLGLLLAVGPMLWVMLRQRGTPGVRRYHALAVLTLFLTFDLVMFGAFTRLTDSGLGCPDWPGCYGQSNPLFAHNEIATAQLTLPDGPVTHGKAWIEMVHRYLATGVGFLIVVLTVMAWRSRWAGWRGSVRAVQNVNPGLPTLALLWVCIQGAFGALTVTMKLFPAIVSLHLLGGYTLLALLTLQVVRSSQSNELQNRVLPISRPIWLLLLAALMLLLLQAASGAWVSTNYAVLACTTFPLCQGQWLPPMDASGFALWRPLGMDASGGAISFQAITAIHIVHRSAAIATGAALAGVSWFFSRPAWPRNLNKPARLLGALVGLQLLTGLSNVVLGWPLVAAVLHTGGAGAMAAALVWMLASSRPVALGSHRSMTRPLQSGTFE